LRVAALGLPLNMTGARTVGCWFKASTLPTLTNVLHSIDHDTNASIRNWIFWLTFESGEYRFKALVRQEGSQSLYYWTWAGADTNAHHVYWQWDPSQPSATEHEVWIDFVSQGNGTAILSPNLTASDQPNTDFKVGWNQGVNHWDGFIDDLRIYDSLVTISIESGNAELADASGTVGYYKFNGDPTDESPGADDLTEVDGTGDVTYGAPLF